MLSVMDPRTRGLSTSSLTIARLAGLVSIAVAVSLPGAASPQSSTPTPMAGTELATGQVPPAPETLALFNLPLKDFEVPADISTGVRLSDGVLWLPPSKRWLLAPRLHDDVLIRFSFRPSANASVGLLLRGYLNPSGRNVQRGYEIWLPPPDRGTGRLVVARTGETTTHKFPERAERHEVPWAGEWHSLVVEAQQGQVTIVLDKRTVFVGVGALTLPGLIGLRAAGGPVEWREGYLRTHSEEDAFAGVPKPGEDGVTTPKLLRDVKPRYAQDAMSRRIEGEVWMDCVVGADGTVTAVRVRTSLDPELDEAAMTAAKQWRFEPGSRDGKPIAVVVTISMGFTLRK